MSIERFSLEAINNMSAETMRQILREREIECMRADQRAAEETARLEKSNKEMDEFFKNKFANEHPKFHDQY